MSTKISELAQLLDNDVDGTELIEIAKFINGAWLSGSVSSTQINNILKALLASTATGEGASLIGVEDVDDHFVSDNTEDVLKEIAEFLYQNGGNGLSFWNLLNGVDPSYNITTKAIANNIAKSPVLFFNGSGTGKILLGYSQLSPVENMAGYRVYFYNISCDQIEIEPYNTNTVNGLSEGSSIILTEKNKLYTLFCRQDGEFFVETDNCIQTTGGTLTGPLNITNGTHTWTVEIDGVSNKLSITPNSTNPILVLNPTRTDNSEVTIFGKIKYRNEVAPINTATLLCTGGTDPYATNTIGATSLILDCSELATTVTIRANTGSPTLDFKRGDFFTVVQGAAGDEQITIDGEGGVIIRVADGLQAKTRTQNSPVTVTCLNDVTNEWLLSGDLAPVL